jgi:magnesium transporter
MTVADSYRPGVWVHLECPSPEERSMVVAMLQVQDDLLGDALDPYEVPRIENEDGVAYVFIQVPHKTDSGVVNVPLLLALGDDFLLTVTNEKFEFWDAFIANDGELCTAIKGKLFVQILFAVSREYTKHLAIIGKNLRSLYANLAEVRIRDISQFVAYEKVLNDFIAALVPMQSICQSFLSGKNHVQREEDRELAEDLFLAVGQLVENSKATLKHSANIREASSMVMNHELNRIMKVLTVWTVMLSIPMILGSFYGMNVPVPLGESPYAFWAVGAVSLAGMAALLGVFVRSRWL